MTERQIKTYLNRINQNDPQKNYFSNVIVPALRGEPYNNETLIYKCPVCDEIDKEIVSFKQYFCFVRHLNEKHRDKLPCKGNVFISTGNSKQRRFVCQLCDLAFNRNEHLTRHNESQKHKKRLQESTQTIGVETISVESKDESNKRKLSTSDTDSNYEYYKYIDEEPVNEISTNDAVTKRLKHDENSSRVESDQDQQSILLTQTSIHTQNNKPFVNKTDFCIQTDACSYSHKAIQVNILCLQSNQTFQTDLNKSIHCVHQSNASIDDISDQELVSILQAYESKKQ